MALAPADLPQHVSPESRSFLVALILFGLAVGAGAQSPRIGCLLPTGV